MTYTVVVIAYRSRDALVPFLDSAGPEVPVVVVNNSADEDDLADLADAPNVTVLDAGGNVGFSAGANLGASVVASDYIVFMNPDTLPTADTLGALVQVLDERPDVAACGPTGTTTAGGGAQPSIPRVLVHVLGLHRVAPMRGIYLRPRDGARIDAGWISGSCCAIRRADFEHVGGYDERYFVFMSDFELGIRLRNAGRGQLLLGDVVVPHLDGRSSDIPSSWAWQQRGIGWGEFLRRTQPRWRGRVVYGLLAAGFSIRRVVYALTGRGIRSVEQATMVRGMRRGWESAA